MVKLALLAVLVTSCLIKPDRVTGDGGGTSSDGHPLDGEGSGSGSGNAPFKARLISTAYFGNAGGSTAHQSATTWELTTGGVLPGDLVIVIGNVDGNVAFTDIGPNFDLLKSVQFGPGAGQTYVALSKFADTAEPAQYGGSYGGATTTGFSSLALVAISNAAAAVPIEADNHDGCVMSCAAPPAVKMTAQPVTTVADGSLILYAGGADWLGANEKAAFGIPTGMASLLKMTDQGEASPLSFQKTTLMLASAVQPVAGMSEVYDGTTTNIGAGGSGGLAWTITIAIAPKP